VGEHGGEATDGGATTVDSGGGGVVCF